MTQRWICAAFTLLAACSASDSEKTSEPVALVQLAAARPGTLGDALALYGAVEPGAGSERTLSAPTEAIVTAITAPAGTGVSAGALVLQLNASPQSALDLAKARSDGAAADAALARALRLKADGLVGNAEVEAARAAASAA
ncbi:MAG TPA: efflux RND transporter periplasmic adaptor subunit, partial [Novosphingobium sp.]|nr:efflux RND transporter periplasmic adaptor subunit [Novosphingobium sp.]